jgi:uncharacterized protein
LSQNIIDSLKDEVKRRCESENNFFGMGGYYHIKAVVKNAIILAENYSADIEVVTIGAWLHDIASVTDYSLYEEHHIHGAKIAGDMLEHLNYPKEKIEQVQKCILNHRGSKLMEKSSKEEICVADADAISHFDNLPSLFHLAYVVRNYSISEGINFVQSKLMRSYKKLSAESKEVYREKYDTVMTILDLKLI